MAIQSDFFPVEIMDYPQPYEPLAKIIMNKKLSSILSQNTYKTNKALGEPIISPRHSDPQTFSTLGYKTRHKNFRRSA